LLGDIRWKFSLLGDFTWIHPEYFPYMSVGILKRTSIHKPMVFRFALLLPSNRKHLKISPNGCYRVLVRNKLNRLPENIKKRSRNKFKSYEKKVPGHHIQIDVKFLFFKNKQGKRIKRYQYTAIDDCTRIRALKIYSQHTQASSIDFLNYVVDKFPFRIKMIRTDNGHEFQTRFHWHVSDLGMIHVYIKPATPRLNGKVERSHLTDQREFYQVLDYTGDTDLQKKLAQWEDYYNFLRPHFSHKGKTPYEKLKQCMLG